jgi:hypothetical protein
VSRLESFIRRLQAQRDCLDMAFREISGLEGPVLELGLGNGRTYDHIRERLPERRIIVFERDVNAHAACRPASGDLILGDLSRTLADAEPLISAKAALAHSDIGCGNPAVDADLAQQVSRHLPRLLREKAVVVSDQPLASSLLLPLVLPTGVAAGRYFVYRRKAQPGT